MVELKNVTFKTACSPPLAARAQKILLFLSFGAAPVYVVQTLVHRTEDASRTLLSKSLPQ